MNTSPSDRSELYSGSIGPSGRDQRVHAVTYDDRLFVGLGDGVVQPVEERGGDLAHGLHVGEQPVYVNNLAEQ